jgi:glutamyl-tRNA reductase
MPAIPQAAPLAADTPEPRGEGSSDPVGPLRFFLAELSLRTSDLEGLDAVVRALSADGGVPARAARLPAEEAALLATCHRAELLLVLGGPEDLEPWLHSLPGHRAGWRIREGREAVRHLFRVAAGEESLARGEREVREQVRRAATSVVSRHPRPVLRPLLEGAVSAAEEAAPHVPASRSIAAVAATRALELVARPFPRVLVVGSGTVGRQLAEALAPYARVALAFRQRAPEPSFLRAVGARAVGPGELADELRLSDVVFTAAKSGHRCLGPNDLPTDRPVVVVDLGVPRNVDPEVRRRPGVTLVDLEELGRHPIGAPFSEGAARRLEAAVDRAAGELEQRLLEPWVTAVLRAAEEVRRSELATARRFLGPLDQSQLAAVDRLSRRLVSRLLADPARRLRGLPPGPEGARIRRLALELLRPGT